MKKKSVNKNTRHATIGERLKSLRKQHGTNQAKLGTIAGVSASAVCSWEKGKTNPTTDKLILICQYYKISVNYLIGGDSRREAKGLTKKEYLLELWDSLTPTEQTQVLSMINVMKNDGAAHSLLSAAIKDSPHKLKLPRKKRVKHEP